MEENKELSEERTIAKSKQKPRGKRKKIVFAFILIALIIGYIIFRGDYLEILEISQENSNYISVFWQNIKNTIIVFGINFLILYFLIYITNQRIKKGLKNFFEEEKKEIPKMPNKSIAFIGAVVISSITTQLISEKVILFIHNTLFGINDPIFGYDIGYFLFQKPLWEFLIAYLLWIAIGLTIYTTLYYIITFNFYFDGINRQTLKNSLLLKQIFSTIMVISILIAGYTFIKTQDAGTQKFLHLEDETSYSLYGAGFVDATVKLWGYRILAVVIPISVYLGIRSFKMGKTKKVIACILVVPTYICVLILLMLGIQLIFVNSNELDKEKKYIANNINYTKNAYGINIEEITVKDGGTITKETIENQSQVTSNIAIVDEDIVLKDLNGGQTGKGYYSYRDTQIGKYQINGEDKLVYISPREILSSIGTYNNKTYEYTHGFGAIITSATSTNTNGNLENLQKGFENGEQVIPITQPRIYFGLETNDTVVINSKNKKEFDYPILDSASANNAENNYNGKAGLRLNFLDRFILAIKEKDLKLAFSGNVTQDSKILTNRNIIQRAKTVMPYLLYDENPYMVINEEGRLIWVLDAYTTSNDYPYSQRTVIQQENGKKIELNYIRNSVKVLIDSYDGTMKFYITDRTDPIIMAYRNRYPGVFADLEESIPEDIKKHFVYPQFLYEIQAEVMKRYHNIQPDVLYRGDDIWEIATHNTSKVLTKTGTEMTPYYTMVKTIDQEEPRLGLMIPFTPYNKQNISAYLIGSYDNSGQAILKLYKFSTDSNILGPMQLDTQIEQDERISKEIETLNVNGTKLIKNMIIVPFDHTLLYVEPIYQQYINEADALPTLKKVVVASGNKVAIGDNLNEALTNLVSQYAVDIEVENTEDIEGLIDVIIKANQNLTNSLENQDWEMMGKDIKRLQDLIQKLQTATEEEKKNEQEINEIGEDSNILINITSKNDV